MHDAAHVAQVMRDARRLPLDLHMRGEKMVGYSMKGVHIGQVSAEHALQAGHEERGVAFLRRG